MIFLGLTEGRDIQYRYVCMGIITHLIEYSMISFSWSRTFNIGIRYVSIGISTYLPEYSMISLGLGEGRGRGRQPQEPPHSRSS